MNILYDCQAFNMQKFGGITRYFTNLFTKINDTEHNAYIGVAETENEYLLNLGFNSPEMLKQLAISSGNSPDKFANIDITNVTYSSMLINTGKYDIVHTTFFYITDFSSINTSTKIVMTIHDMIPEIYNWTNGEDIQIVNKPIIANIADAIICPSECTKQDIIKYMPNVDANKIHVIPHGIEKQKIYNIDNPMDFEYVLYIGSRQTAYKRWQDFIINIKTFIDNHPSINIICTGEPFTTDEIVFIHNLQLTGRVINISANNNTINLLYQHAIALVFPSEYEGFGLPIIEAWANNCITILNDISVFREIADGASLFFDINNHESLNKVLETVITMSPEKRELLKYKQSKRLSKYTLTECVNKHLEVYNSLIN